MWSHVLHIESSTSGNNSDEQEVEMPKTLKWRASWCLQSSELELPCTDCGGLTFRIIGQEAKIQHLERRHVAWVFKPPELLPELGSQKTGILGNWFPGKPYYVKQIFLLFGSCFSSKTAFTTTQSRTGLPGKWSLQERVFQNRRLYYQNLRQGL